VILSKKITRRDFINGTQVAIGAGLMSPWSSIMGTQPAPGTAVYPPALTGMRGSHDGSWEAMHALVSGQTWPAVEVEEKYDLVVVGGGISGLSAAFFYRQKNPGAKILVLDNHDDFGGHAKRNEFQIGGQTRIGYGGTEAIDTPSSFAPQALQMLKDLGIDLQRFYTAFDDSVYTRLGLSKGIMFDEQNFGQQKLAVGYGSIDWQVFADKTPLNEQARADLVRLQTSDQDYLPGLSDAQRYKLLSRTSYASFLQDYAKVDPQIIQMYRKWGSSYWCVGIDEIPASVVQQYNGMPGLDHTLKYQSEYKDDPYIFHFPDGNASIARLLVRALIPAAVPGHNQEDLVTSRVDYSLLDKPGPARVRLNSTVISARHTPTQDAVDITYVKAGKVIGVRARDCIMACYNMAIPYLCPELPAAQKAGLAYGVKAPLTYTKVLVSNWRAFANLGVDHVYYTNDFFKQVELDFPISIGKYQASKTPDEPMILHMCYVHDATETKGPRQWQEGRRKLLETPFSVFESHVRNQLNQALAAGGFDADRDIEAITVNRWPHGYAYDPNLIWEPEWSSDAEKPWVIGRQAFGRIKIANSDAQASAMTQAAIEQAWRAVEEI
jgi:spermidine dehydrogenase